MELHSLISPSDRQVGQKKKKGKGQKKKQFQESQSYPDQTYGNVLGGLYAILWNFIFNETITMAIIFKITCKI